MTDSFSALHPALTFCYFAAVLLLSHIRYKKLQKGGA